MRYIALLMALFTLATPALAVDLINTLPGIDPGPFPDGNFDTLPNRILYKEGQSFNTTATDYTVTKVVVPLAWQWDAGNKVDFDFAVSLYTASGTNTPSTLITSQTYSTAILNDSTFTNVEWNLNETLTPSTSYFVTVGATTATGLTASNAGLLWGFNNLVNNYGGWQTGAASGGSYWAYTDYNTLAWGSSLNTASGNNAPQGLLVSTDIVPVPEPSTYVSGLLGAGAMVLAYRHKRAKACAS